MCQVLGSTCRIFIGTACQMTGGGRRLSEAAVPTETGLALDSDSDGIPDHLDPDSDGDSKPDAEEGAADADSDGLPDAEDSAPASFETFYSCPIGTYNSMVNFVAAASYGNKNSDACWFERIPLDGTTSSGLAIRATVSGGSCGSSPTTIDFTGATDAAKASLYNYFVLGTITNSLVDVDWTLVSGSVVTPPDRTYQIQFKSYGWTLFSWSYYFASGRSSQQYTKYCNGAVLQGSNEELVELSYIVVPPPPAPPPPSPPPYPGDTDGDGIPDALDPDSDPPSPWGYVPGQGCHEPPYAGDCPNYYYCRFNQDDSPPCNPGQNCVNYWHNPPCNCLKYCEVDARCCLNPPPAPPSPPPSQL